jgi:hypothetical protein
LITSSIVCSITSLAGYVYDLITDYFGNNNSQANQDTSGRAKISDVYIETACSLPEVEVCA